MTVDLRLTMCKNFVGFSLVTCDPLVQRRVGRLSVRVVMLLFLIPIEI